MHLRMNSTLERLTSSYELKKDKNCVRSSFNGYMKYYNRNSVDIRHWEMEADKHIPLIWDQDGNLLFEDMFQFKRSRSYRQRKHLQYHVKKKEVNNDQNGNDSENSSTENSNNTSSCKECQEEEGNLTRTDSKKKIRKSDRLVNRRKSASFSDFGVLQNKTLFNKNNRVSELINGASRLRSSSANCMRMLKLRKQQVAGSFEKLVNTNEHVAQKVHTSSTSSNETFQDSYEEKKEEQIQDENAPIEVTPVDKMQEEKSPAIIFERLAGETEEDAEMRIEALQSRTRSRSSTVVQIPTASIQMDLHTLYMDNLNSSKTFKKGKTLDEPRQRKYTMPRNASFFSLDGETEKKGGRFSLLKQKFKREGATSLTTLDDFHDFLKHLRSNLINTDKHELAIYKGSHWSTIGKFNDICDGATVVEKAKISDQERSRFEAIWELFYAEITYLVDHLLVLHDVFAKSVEHAKCFGFLDDVDEVILFANLKSLIKVTGDFAKKLLKIFKDCGTSLSGSTEVICEGFKDFDNVLTPEYNEYCLNYQRAKNHIKNLKDDEFFVELCKWCEQDDRCKRLRLEDFLVAPLQHLTKYPLLLKAIRKQAPKDENNNQLLTTTIVDIEKSIKSIEKKISSVMNTQRIQELQELITWPNICDNDKSYLPDCVRLELNNNHCDSILMNPNRTLIQEGCLSLAGAVKEHNKGEFYVFLFDDMLLITKCRKKMKRRNTSPEENKASIDIAKVTKKRSTSHENINNQNQYAVHKQPIPLDRLKLYDCEEQKDAYKHTLCIVHSNRYHQAISAYTFQVSSSNEKTKWIKNIKKAQDEMYIDAHSSSTREQSSDEEYML